VHLLGYNSRRYLRACLQAVLDQTHRPLEVIFSDNASGDGSAQRVTDLFPSVRVLANAENLGFCAGHNRGIRASNGEFVMVLNPDVRLTRTFVSSIVRAMAAQPEVGAATGRLRRCTFDAEKEEFLPVEPPVLDSTGVFLDRWRRAWDRGADTFDNGRFAFSEPVFAACGAAAVYRRQMLEDIAEEGQYFDESFFLSFEDIDLGWRAQRAGWRCLYVSEAIAYHVRAVQNIRGLRHVARRARTRAGAFRESQSLKNRYLMMLKNESKAEFARDLVPIVLFEALRLFTIAALQPKVLPGLIWFLRAAPEALRRRRLNSPDSAKQQFRLSRWFGYV